MVERGLKVCSCNCECAYVCLYVDVLLLGSVVEEVVWCSDPDRAVWEHQGMDGGRGGREGGVQQHVKPGNRCVFTTGKPYQHRTMSEPYPF